MRDGRTILKTAFIKYAAVKDVKSIALSQNN
jgi:hypothetical protein